MKKAWNVLKLLAAAMLFFLAVRGQAMARQGADIATVFLEEEPLDLARAQEICSQEAELEEGAALCFWQEEKNIPISCQGTGKSSTVTLLTTQGNPDLVVPGAVSLAWQQKGCMVDRKTAEDLFGTANANGQVIWYGTDSYTVCQTFESMEPMMIRPAGSLEDGKFSSLSLRFQDSKNVRTNAEQFLMRYELFGTVIDFIFLDAIVSDLLLLFPAVLAIRLAGLLAVERRKMGIAASAAVIGITLYLIGQRVVIPSDMVPSQWSDFSFWPEWWQNQRQNLLQILGTSLGDRQLTMIFQMIKSMVLSLAAVFLSL